MKTFDLADLCRSGARSFWMVPAPSAMPAAKVTPALIVCF